MGKNCESLIDEDSSANGETYIVNVDENNMKVLGYSVAKKEPEIQKVKK